MTTRLDKEKADILAALADGEEKNAKQIGFNMTCSAQRVTRVLCMLVTEKKVHVSRTWSATKFYRIGECGPIQPTIEERILAALADGPLTAKEIGAKLGIQSYHVRSVINEKLRTRSNRKVRIHRFLKDGRQVIHQYGLGHMPDAPRPKPLSRTEISRLQRIRLKQDVEAVIKERARNVARHTKPKADPFMSQFAGIFGGSAKAATNTISPLEKA